MENQTAWGDFLPPSCSFLLKIAEKELSMGTVLYIHTYRTEGALERWWKAICPATPLRGCERPRVRKPTNMRNGAPTKGLEYERTVQTHLGKRYSTRIPLAVPFRPCSGCRFCGPPSGTTPPKLASLQCTLQGRNRDMTSGACDREDPLPRPVNGTAAVFGGCIAGSMGEKVSGRAGGRAARHSCKSLKDLLQAPYRAIESPLFTRHAYMSCRH
jgi:hypothetical protein